ncbi:Hypothetical predicted protein [Paramuricea clavata]|uniref:Uncharacterized protein n=1 Tax=Paramuricea clavata TaxID=317549 RepID=A0A7D9EEE7_PARCT|nr:Hypothetical predicted protein [Paramuricea clavata]
MADSQELEPSTSTENPSNADRQNKPADRKAYFAKRNASKVCLNTSIERWKRLKEENDIKSDQEFADILLNLYEVSGHHSSIQMRAVETQTNDPDETMESLFGFDMGLIATSTPQNFGNNPSPLLSVPSNMSAVSSRRRLIPDSSPLGSPPRHTHDETLTASEVDSDSDSETLTAHGLSSVHVTQDLDQTYLELPDENDIFNITINGHDGDEIHQEHEDKGTAPHEYVSTVDVVTPEEAIKMEKCIVFTDTLMLLITSLHGSVCKRANCGHPLHYKKTYVGTCLVVSWGCNSGHVGGRWSAQPSCDKIRAGNLILASSLLLSGNLSKKLYIIPAINKFWEQHQKQLWKEKAGKEVVLSGDGRNDSPGHSAQYCTYSLADMDDQAILQMNVVDVREASGKSNNMERIGFERGMDALLTSTIVLKEVVTDGHLEIGALMNLLHTGQEINLLPWISTIIEVEEQQQQLMANQGMDACSASEHSDGAMFVFLHLSNTNTFLNLS